MKKDFDVTGLSLKAYRDMFCKDLTLEVVKRAYGYSQNGHMPQNAIATAAVIYAEPFKRRNLLQIGLMAEKTTGGVTIWNLKTETVTAQRALLQGKWDFHNRAMCIARLGENYECACRATFEFSGKTVIGVYEHCHRFVAVVRIETDCESDTEKEQMQKAANIAAMNALAYYPEYSEYVTRYQNATRFEPKCTDYRRPNGFKSYLSDKPLRFAENINQEYSVLRPKKLTTVGDFLNSYGQWLGYKLKLAKIDVFGDF